MDVSVAHLNNRLALQLPRELPLGLVFVVGTVSFSGTAVSTELVAHNRYQHIHFDLLDERHRIRCVLVVRAGSEYTLELGSRVRVGGHLRFDAQRADYYLIARDVEQLDEDVLGDVEPVAADQEEITALLADIRKRTTQSQLPTDLPDWVQKLAPEPFQQNEADDVPENEGETAVSAQTPPTDSVASSISELLDQPEDVELTPDLISTLEEKAPILDENTPVLQRQVPAKPRTGAPSSSRNSPDYLLWLLAIVLFLIVVLVLVLILQ